jgi:hypothetical protein
VVTGTGKVLYPAAADEDYAMLLKVVSFTGDIARNLNAVRQTDPGDLTQGGVRLLGSRGLDGRADASLLRGRSVDGALVQGIVTSLQCGSR